MSLFPLKQRKIARLDLILVGAQKSGTSLLFPENTTFVLGRVGDAQMCDESPNPWRRRSDVGKRD